MSEKRAGGEGAALRSGASAVRPRCAPPLIAARAAGAARSDLRVDVKTAHDARQRGLSGEEKSAKLSWTVIYLRKLERRTTGLTHLRARPANQEKQTNKNQ